MITNDRAFHFCLIGLLKKQMRSPKPSSPTLFLPNPSRVLPAIELARARSHSSMSLGFRL